MQTEMLVDKKRNGIREIEESIVPCVLVLASIMLLIRIDWSMPAVKRKFKQRSLSSRIPTKYKMGIIFISSSRVSLIIPSYILCSSAPMMVAWNFISVNIYLCAVYYFIIVPSFELYLPDFMKRFAFYIATSHWTRVFRGFLLAQYYNFADAFYDTPAKYRYSYLWSLKSRYFSFAIYLRIIIHIRRSIFIVPSRSL